MTTAELYQPYAACLALSVRQPYAWLIVNGHKPFENRDWSRQFPALAWLLKRLQEAPLMILIHAAKGGRIIDAFTGSGTVLFQARAMGLRAIGIEKRACQCEHVIKRLAQGELSFV